MKKEKNILYKKLKTLVHFPFRFKTLLNLYLHTKQYLITSMYKETR